MRQSTSFTSLLLALFWCCNLAAQTHTIDVIHLKNGTVYKGIIIENIPDEKLKLQTNDGVFVIRQSEISNITQEESKKKIKPLREQPQEKEVKERKHIPPHLRTQGSGIWEPVEKGFFFQGQMCGEIGGGGVRFVNGYKFNRFAYLGFATGIEGVIFAISDGIAGSIENPFEGFYMPFLLHLSGNIINRKKTPVYFIEIGYNHGLTFPNDFPVKQNTMGLNATTGIGFKVYNGNKFTFSLLPNCAFRYFVKKETTKRKPIETTVTKGYRFYPGLRLCFGFN